MINKWESTGLKHFNDLLAFRKKLSAEMKLEEAEKMQNVLKPNLNRISRGRYKSEEQKMTSNNVKLFYESREAAIELFNDYSLILSEVKYKKFRRK